MDILIDALSTVNPQGAGILFTFTVPLLGELKITESAVSVLVVTLVLAIAGILLGRNLKKRPGKLQVLTEKGVTMLHNIVCETMGAHNARWTPYIGTIFLSSICGSLLGMTGFLKSSTADLSVSLTWAIMTSVIIWYHSIKHNGFFGWLKGFAEPIFVMTPMNIISEIAQPLSMAFRHFGNVAGGGVITSILYTALGAASTLLIGFISQTVILPIVMLGLGIGFAVYGFRKKKLLFKILGIVFAVISVVGLLQYLNPGIQIPILQFGIPAVLSIYFDLFSGFVQAFVFSLLSMVYIAGSCPPVEKTAEQ